MILRLLKLVLMTALLPAWLAVAQYEDEPYGPQPTGAPEAAKQFASNNTMKDHLRDCRVLRRCWPEYETPSRRPGCGMSLRLIGCASTPN